MVIEVNGFVYVVWIGYTKNYVSDRMWKYIQHLWAYQLPQFIH